MATHKYGLFSGGIEKPLQTFEGDSMGQNGDHVFIFKGQAPKREQVAAVKLGDGQCVKEIT